MSLMNISLALVRVWQIPLRVIITIKTGRDGISNKLINIAVNELVSPLTIVINQMLNTGVIPNQLKISKVTPKYKSKDHTLLINYRPIALLPSISKIF